MTTCRGMAPTAFDALYFAGTPYGAKKDLDKVHESEGRESERERECGGGIPWTRIEYMNQKEERARESGGGIPWTRGFREGSTKGEGKVCAIGESRDWGERLEKTNVSNLCDRV